MKGFLLFPGLFSFFVVWAVISEWSTVSLVFLFLWSVRIVCLRRPRIVVLAVVMGGAAGWRAHHQVTQFQTLLDEETEHFFVTLHQETLRIDGDRLQVYGTVEERPSFNQEEEDVVVFYTLSSEGEKKQWENRPVPEKVKISGELKTPSSQRNPHQFDYAAFLKQRNIHWVLEANALEIMPGAPSNESWFSVLLHPEKWRRTVLSDIEERLSGKTADYTRMLLFADRDHVEENVMENFRKAGVIHLLSISGLHIQFLIKGLEWVLLRAGLTRERVPYVFLFLLPVYGTLAGWGTSVFRAICQSWLLFAGKTLSWKIHGLDAWAATLFFACLIQPYALLSVGFQLSYALSLTLLLIHSSKWMNRVPSRYTPLLTTVLLSVVSIPFLSYHFFEFPWASVLANWLFVPLFSWAVLPGVIGIYCLSFFFSEWSAFSYLIEGMEGILTLLEWLVGKAASLPGLTVVTGRLPLLGSIGVLAGILLLFYGLEKTKKHNTFVILLSVCCMTAGLLSQRYSPAGKVVVLDVGQGDAIFIKQPFNGKNLLIDTGGQHEFEQEDWQLRETPYSIGRDVVAPVLKSYGISSLDQAVLTHSHIDHTGALLDLSEDIHVEQLLLTKGTLREKAVLETAKKLEETGTVVRTVLSSAERPVLLESGLGVLWPFEEGSGSNNDSIVLYGKLGEHTWLFTGDLEEEGEKALLETYPHLRADVLKAAHHGSRTSTSESFLKSIAPRTAVISCGKNNWYGHPHEEVLGRLEKFGTNVWRTDQSGGMVYTYFPWENSQKSPRRFHSP